MSTSRVERGTYGFFMRTPRCKPHRLRLGSQIGQLREQVRKLRVVDADSTPSYGFQSYRVRESRGAAARGY